MPLMTQDTTHGWLTELPQQGLVIAPVVLKEAFPGPITAPPWRYQRLRDAYLALGQIEGGVARVGDLSPWLDAVLEDFLGYGAGVWRGGQSLPAAMAITTYARERVRPNRVLFADAGVTHPLLAAFVDPSPRLGMGRGRQGAGRLVEWCRQRDQRLALLTNGRQFRLYYVGLDHEAWIEWDAAVWFQEGELRAQLDGFLTLLGPHGTQPRADWQFPLLDAALASRTRQSDLSQTLGGQVRDAIELLMDQVDLARRRYPTLLDHVRRFDPVDSLETAAYPGAMEHRLDDRQVRAALYQAATRLMMRLVVTLFAEARGLLPRDSEVYRDSYGVEGLFTLLQRAGNTGGRDTELAEQGGAWRRLLALFRLIHGGSGHAALALQAYGGQLFAPGDPRDRDPVIRALAAIESPQVWVSDAVVLAILKKLKIGKVQVRRGRGSTWVTGPVDFSELRTEYIGMMYEGLLDYELRAEPDDITVFLRIGNEPALPLARLEAMSDKQIAQLFEQVKKETKGAAGVGGGEDESAEGAEVAEGREDFEHDGHEGDTKATNEDEASADGTEIADDGEGDEGAIGDGVVDQDRADRAGRERVLAWARRAVVAAKLVRKPKKGQSATEEIEKRAAELIGRIIAAGQWYLIRESGMRKGSGTFYTKPALAVPTAIRALEPLVYMRGADGGLVPREPETILGVRVVDPACGSASFLVAALHLLTDALWQALVAHNQGDPAGEPRYIVPVGNARQTVLRVPGTAPLTIDEYHDADRFEERARARLRRQIVERCLYGVDLNPLAVDLARLSLWIETLDPDLPFSFLDHKIKVGNALIGAWLDTFQEYPLAAWLREGGDKAHPTSVHFKQGGWTNAIKDRFNDVVKPEMIDRLQEIQQSRLAGMVDDVATVAYHDQLREAIAALHALPHETAEDTERREQGYAALRESTAYQALRDALDTWCALWFWPGDREWLDHAPTPQDWPKVNETARAMVRAIGQDLRFFHWEIEFPDVFAAPGAGFDAVIANPPWDVQKPDSREFFVRYDPAYRGYNKQEALQLQRDLFAREVAIERAWLGYSARFKALSNWVGQTAYPWGDPDEAGEDIALKRGGDNRLLHTTWRRRRTEHASLARAERAHPFRYQGSADLNLYKLFAELAHALVRSGGRIGMILPSALGSDEGSRDLRRLFLDHCTWEWDFVWMNKAKIFEIDGRYKFGAITVQKGGATAILRGAFSRIDPCEWERPDECAGRVDLPAATLRRLSPASLAIVEPGTMRDLALLEKLYDPRVAVLLGDQSDAGWGITYRTEFHMTNDSDKFHPRPWWEERGYRPDPYGRWVNDAGEMAMPLYQGRMVNHFDFSEKRWIKGSGRTADWSDIGFIDKDIAPQFLMVNTIVSAVQQQIRIGSRLVIMDVGSATNRRTMISCVVPAYPCGNKVPILSILNDSLPIKLELSTLLDSFSYDYSIRMRLGGLSLNHFIIAETPLLRKDLAQQYPLAQWAARLTMIHPLWAREWAQMRREYPAFGERPWRAWWAVTEAERLRLRCMIDAVVAHAWGLDEADMAWLLRDDPGDPKGFWRVDKEKPIAERQTTLTLRAFQDLRAVGVERFCREEWWGVPGAVHPPEHYAEDEIAASWAECDEHARILTETDPLRPRPVVAGDDAGEGGDGTVEWGERGPEQGRLFDDRAARQQRLGEE